MASSKRNFSAASIAKWSSMMDRYVANLWKRTKALPNGCIVWTGGKDWNGYGMTYMFGKQWRANRLFYFLYHGEIPLGYQVLHRCDNPPCINPDHLFMGTGKDNVQDALRKGRMTGPTGELNGQHKLTNKQILEILKRYIPYNRLGCNMYGLAKEYGVHPVTIHDILRGKKWRSVTGLPIKVKE